MRGLTLTLRWSLRDLRAHLAKVAAIALVIAIGTGGYAGLTSTTAWREVSYPASYELLAMYDVRVDLAVGALAERGGLEAAAGTIGEAGRIEAIEERLIVPIQVEASSGGQPVIVRGQLTGSDFTGAGPTVGKYHVIGGRPLTEADRGRPVAMIETTFADLYGLADSGRIAVSGGRELDYVATATSPEFFTVAPEGGMFMSEATFAAVFTTLETAQDVAGAAGMVNNLVLTLRPGTDRALVVDELEEAVSGLELGATVSTRDDNLSYTALNNDIDQDQAMFNALATLLMLGAVGAAVNLVNRMVQQQRREIGIGMALGVPPAALAARPMLVTLQISLLGVLFGVGVGMLIGRAMGNVLRAAVPIPIWDTSFQPEAFVGVAIVGAVMPLLASAVPVWRSVRVSPIEAIRPGHLVHHGHTPRGRRRHAASTLTSIPFHDLVRDRRRTTLTVLALAAAITVMVGFRGIADSMFHAVDTAETEAMGQHPDRITVGLDTFHLVDSPEVAAIADAGSVSRVEPTLRLPVALRAGDIELEALVEVVDLRNGMWRPSVTTGSIDGGGGLIITDKAARDLGVGVGDTVILRHPRREGLASFSRVDTPLPVLATHPYPVRAMVYMDAGDAAIFNLDGITNGLNLLPAPGASDTDVQRDLFDLRYVASVTSVTRLTEAVRDAFAPLVGIIGVMVVAALLLALLIAFNSASINLESRAREHATMFAFGVRVRTALRMASVENLVVAIAATSLGTLGGLAMVWWITQRILTESLPDFGLAVVLAPETMVMVAVMGIGAVVSAPLLTVRRMMTMNLPGTLRLVE